MSHADPTTRGHRGLIAVAIVIGSALALWVATVILVRHSARARIEATITRLRAGGAIGSPEAAWGPRPAAQDDGMTPLRTLLVVCAEVGVSACGLPGNTASERDDLENAAARVELSAVERDAWRLHAELDPEHAAIALAREGADKPALWMDTRSNARDRDATAIVLASRILERSAIVAASRGDDEMARADVARILRLRAGLDFRPWYMTAGLQSALTTRAATAMGTCLAHTGTTRAWLEFDAALESIDPGASVRREFWWECTELVVREEAALAEGASWAPGGERAWQWPASWLARAEEVDEIACFDVLVARGLRAVIESPRFRFPEPGTSCFPPSGPRWTWWVQNAAREQSFIVFARGALRARFEGADAASEFLAQRTDPLAGGLFYSRTNSDGIWIAWCAGTPQRPASPDGPAEFYDLVWPPKP